MQINLIVQAGNDRRVIPVTREVAVIGRARGNAVRVPSADVSRRHCRLIQKDGFLLIEDLKSINGTFLNGRQIRSQEVVRPGDRLEIGPLRCVVGYDLSPAARKKLEAFDQAGVALEASDSGPDFLPDSSSVSLEVIDTAEEIEEAPLDVEAVEDEEPTRHHISVLGDDEWAMPTNLEMGDFLEPFNDDDAEPKKR